MQVFAGSFIFNGFHWVWAKRMACVTPFNGKKIHSAHLSQWVIPPMGCNWAYSLMSRTELFTFGISLTLARLALPLPVCDRRSKQALPLCKDFSARKQQHQHRNERQR